MIEIVIIIGIVVLFPILLWQALLTIIHVGRMVKYEASDSYNENNRYYVEASIRYMRDNYPNYFNEKYERLVYIVFKNDEIVHTYLKEKQKGDNSINCIVPWDYLENIPVEGDVIVGIHQHPKKGDKIRGSWGDSLVHEHMLEIFNHPVSIVTNKDMSAYAEYDDKSSNFIYEKTGINLIPVKR